MLNGDLCYSHRPHWLVIGRKLSWNHEISVNETAEELLFKNFPKFNSSFINFPILYKNKELLSKYLYKNQIDHSKYFYRDCSNLSIFEKFKYNENFNISKIANNIITLPIYHEISEDYLIKVSNVLNKF